MHKKAEKKEKQEKNKLKRAIEQGNHEGAKIYAENAIREKNQGLNYLRLSSRLDAVSSRLESAMKMNQVTKSMSRITKGMQSALDSMDVMKISRVMDSFEKSFEDTDVRSAYIGEAMNNSVSQSAPMDQVDSLISQVADEHGLELSEKFGDVPMGTLQREEQGAEEDDLLARLDALKA